MAWGKKKQKTNNIVRNCKFCSLNRFTILKIEFILSFKTYILSNSSHFKRILIVNSLDPDWKTLSVGSDHDEH